VCQDSKNKKDAEDKDADDKKEGEGGDRKEGEDEEEAEEAVEEEEEDEDEKYKEEYRQMEHELLASCSDEEWQRYETMRCDPHLSPSVVWHVQVEDMRICYSKFWIVLKFRVHAVIPSTRSALLGVWGLGFRVEDSGTVIPSTRRALLGVENLKNNFINDIQILDLTVNPEPPHPKSSARKPSRCSKFNSR
jgi:hypothetical protein